MSAVRQASKPTSTIPSWALQWHEMGARMAWGGREPMSVPAAGPPQGRTRLQSGPDAGRGDRNRPLADSPGEG